MKLNGKALVAVVMMVGAVSAMGCKRSGGDDSVAPEESVASAPVEENATPGVEQNSLRFTYYAPRQPPAPRYETPGRAPSDRHFWANGYWRWNGRDHVWIAGRWEPRRDRYEYVGPRWERRYSRWAYVPGRWVRR